MEHASQIRIIPNAKQAVLFIHGIVGSPRHFSHVLPLIDQLREDWSYYNLLLDGHGGCVGDFSRSSMGKWKEQVWNVFEELSRTHEKVAIVGHSMGCLFALQLAVEFPEKVSFLFLIAAPIRPFVRPSGVACCFRAIYGKARESRPAEVAMLTAGGVKLTRKLWEYIPWAPHMLSLLWEASRTEKMLPKLKSRTIVLQSRHDEMVALSSGSVLEKYSVVSLTTLEDSTHFYYPHDDIHRIVTAFEQACNMD